LNPQSINEWADWWRDSIGVNVIPAISKDKIPIVKWKQFQDKPIPIEVHNQWKEQGLFDNGIAIILGRVWHRNDRTDYNLGCIDIDNRKGIQELFTKNGKQLTIEDLASKTIVEQHRDNPNRLHFYVYTIGGTLRNKSSDVGRLDEDVDPADIPAFEVKATPRFLSFPCPNVHKSGRQIEILGTTEPIVLRDNLISEMQQHIDSICQRYNLEIGSDGNHVPISELFKEDTVIHEGHNRHESILRVMESLLRRTGGLLSANRIESLSKDWNNKHCSPPLDEREFSKQWKCAMDFISRNGSSNSDSIAGDQNPDPDLDVESPSDSDEMRDYEDELIAEYHFKTMTDTTEIYYYDQDRGIYVPNGESILMMRIESDFGRAKPTDDISKRLTTHDFNEHINHIKRRTQTSRIDFNPNIEWLATAECMINLKSGKTEPFSPTFMCTTKIPVKYDPERIVSVYADFFRMVERGKFPKIIDFLFDIMDHKDVNIFLDFMAYCLWAEYRYNNWMLLVGEGNNGKSVLLDLLERFFGEENKSGETLERLQHERFSVANLNNKLINVDADVSSEVVFKKTGILKKLTGNDLHVGEHKFKKAFYFRNHAKLFFSCNRVPETTDMTDGFFRRILQINFTQQFLGEKDDPFIIDKLSSEDQFSILLSELLARLPRVIKDGIRKVTNESLAETHDRFISSSDSGAYFIKKALEDDPQSRIERIEMFEYYNQFCKTERLSPASDSSLSRNISERWGSPRPTRIKGQQIRYWEGVKKVDWKERERMESTLEEKCKIV
jgi:putative DNA primase/helicase